MLDAEISNLLKRAKTIAVVGLSAKPERPSHEVAAYLQQHGYRIIPINPNETGTHILGEVCYPTLVDAVLATGLHIDIVDCFRNAQDIPAILIDAIAVEADCLWMQQGIRNEIVAQQAQQMEMQVVMDKCLKIEHAIWLNRPQ